MIVHVLQRVPRVMSCFMCVFTLFSGAEPRPFLLLISAADSVCCGSASGLSSVFRLAWITSPPSLSSFSLCCRCEWMLALLRQAVCSDLWEHSRLVSLLLQLRIYFIQRWQELWRYELIRRPCVPGTRGKVTSVMNTAAESSSYTGKRSSGVQAVFILLTYLKKHRVRPWVLFF